MKSTDLLSIGDVVERSGVAASALRYYEAEGLISAERSPGGRRMYPRSALRRLAFIKAAATIGLTLPEIRAELALLPANRTPTKADWTRISRHWRGRVEAQIDALTRLRDKLDSCIGCGCLSLKRCTISNPEDAAAKDGPGAVWLAPGKRENL